MTGSQREGAGAGHAARTLAGVAAGGAARGGEDEWRALQVGRFDANALAGSPMLDAVGSAFSVRGFEVARRPVEVAHGLTLGAVEPETRFSSVPVKFPQTGYRVPVELEPVRAVLERAAAVEHEINPGVGECYAYVTVQRTTVTTGEVQRGAAIHSDGVQGPRIQPKAPVERGYLVVDRVAPRFFVQAFDMTGVDPDRHLLDTVFETQARPQAAVTPAAGSLVLFDSYSVHQARPAVRPGPRTFVRVAYSTRQYDWLGNTVNAAFASEYERHGWQFAPRPLPELAAPPARCR